MTPEEFIAGANDPRSAVAVQAMVALAREHLGAFEQKASALPQSLRPAFLPLALTPTYLARAERARDGMSAIRKQIQMFSVASRGWR